MPGNTEARLSLFCFERRAPSQIGYQSILRRECTAFLASFAYGTLTCRTLTRCYFSVSAKIALRGAHFQWSVCGLAEALDMALIWPKS